MFANMLNPTISEIRAWAYSDAEEPDQEWGLYLAWKGEIALFLELATDRRCNKQGYFKYLLYFIVVYDFKTAKTVDDKKLALQAYLDKSQQMRHGDIRVWRKDVEALQKDLASFSYETWIKNGLQRGLGWAEAENDTDV